MKTKTFGSRFGSSYDDYKVSVPEGTSGSITIKRFVVTEADSRADAMRSIFSGSARFVDPGTYTGMYEGGVLWMSDTRDEIHDHSGAIIEATGRVLIHGLGIGMVVQACLRKKDVKHVTVVEKSADVIALVAPHYQKMGGKRKELDGTWLGTTSGRPSRATTSKGSRS